MLLLPKRSSKPRVVLGVRDSFLGRFYPRLAQFSVPLDKLDTHLYVVGRSGKGKSKFLESLLWQLITRGQPCALIDPHGDLANNLLKLLAFERQRGATRPWLSDPANAAKVIYCEPGRPDYFIPMNLLAGRHAPYTLATNVIEAFQRTWSRELEAAPQFKNVTLHGLLLLIEQRLSLVELPRLFLYQAFRRTLLDKSRNEDVIGFFERRFGRWGQEQSLRIESLLNKVTALTLNPALKLMLSGRENGLDMRRIMDTGHILIINLATCDHETRDLLGSLLTVSLEQAALSRATLEEEQRAPYFCVIDEFQRFVANEGSAQVLAQMLSEVRKMGLRLCLAHQGWHQIGNQRLEGALDQAQIKVVFGSGTQTGRVVAEELFVPDPHKIKSESSSGNPYYESLMEQKELFVQAIRTQKRRQIFVLPPESDQVMALKTLTVPQPAVDREAFERLKVALLKRWGKPVAPARQATTVWSAVEQTNGQFSASGLVPYGINGA